MNELIVFAGVIALASVSPGPKVILVVNHTLSFGLPRIVPTILGNISLLFLVAVAAALGVSAVLMSVPAAYDGLQAIGAAYLAYLGIKALRNAWRSRGGAVVDGQPAESAGPVRRYLQAFFVSATNLGSVFFLAALFPNFLHHDQPLLSQFVALFATLIVVVGAVHFGYALSAAAVQSRLGARRFRSAVQTASGVALLGFSAAIFGSVLRRT
ncbi:LysE family translocator [Reyranella soli]|uniref:Amino acid transporter n=1 Tax=Reyranella soli TaxID=1230389 RepID=A0A512NCT4_9HYPH|nr:LysE family translocator [Reyranella soli]GEP56752.1 amino acid transporter [Reyranella soli]